MNLVAVNSSICYALGLDPKEVQALNIKIRPDAPPRIFVKRMVRSVDTDAFQAIQERYELVERKA